MKLTDLQQVATTVALNHGLDPALVQAVCHHESVWDPWAIRYEPAFFRRYIESMKGLTDTEKSARAFSYGLMQIMGQVAREFGFDGKYLTELCDPLTNLNVGCRKLKKCLDNKDGEVRKALLAYNGGGNLKYPDLVMDHFTKYSEKRSQDARIH